MPEDRQTVVLYSNSSNGPAVNKLANRISENRMVTISHGDTSDTVSAVTQLVHEVWWTEEGTKKKKLLSLLADDKLYRWVKICLCIICQSFSYIILLL